MELYVTNRSAFKPVNTGIAIIKTVHDLYPDDFEFLPSGNFNRLIGNGWVKTMIEQGASIDEIAKNTKQSKTVYEYQKEVFALLGRAGAALLYFD